MKLQSCLLVAVVACVAIGVTGQTAQPYLVAIWIANEPTTTTETTTTPTTTTPTTTTPTTTTSTTTTPTTTTPTTTTETTTTPTTTTETTTTPTTTTPTTTTPTTTTPTTTTPTTTTPTTTTPTTTTPTTTTHTTTTPTTSTPTTTTPTTTTPTTTTPTTTTPTTTTPTTTTPTTTTPTTTTPTTTTPTTTTPTTTTPTTTTPATPPTEAKGIKGLGRMIHKTDKLKYRIVPSTQKLVGVAAGVEYTAVCTGALIDKRHVLTSATCAKLVKPNDKITTASLTHLDDVMDADYYTIEEVYLYGNPVINNVAVLKLTKGQEIAEEPVKRGEAKASVNTTCYSSFWDIAGSKEQNVEGRIVTPCYVDVQKRERICAASLLVGVELSQREGAVLVCDDLLSGIFSITSNTPPVTGLMTYQETSLYNTWMTQVINAASQINMAAATALCAVAIIVAVTAF